MSTFDFTTLTPVERIALADALYDRAMQEIDATIPPVSAEQLADLTEWDDLHAQMAQR